MSTWWSDRPLRIYHPNARELEFGEIDADALVRDSLAASAEAVVVSAGGIYAFYPTRVPFHYVSPTTRGRNVIGEIVERAHDRGLKVLARLDFSRARDEVHAAHPEWFEREPDGGPRRIGAMFATCPLGGYQNEAFAFAVFRELLEEQRVDGFHLNAHGFTGPCHCAGCRAAFGAPIPGEGPAEAAARERFLLWRCEALAAHLRSYHDLVRSIRTDAFLMAEHAGEEYPEWALRSAYHLPSLRDAFGQVLASSGGLAAERRSRWWAAMTADRISGTGARPIINNKLQMRDVRLTHAALPPEESELQCWQSLAHGAGLKLVTFGVPRTLADPRLMRSVATVFGFMREHDRLLAGAEPVAPVALVSPERAVLRRAADGPEAAGGLRAEFRGLYDALASLHALFGVVADTRLEPEVLARYRLVVIPGLAGVLDDRAAAALAGYVAAGGRVVLTDSLARGRDARLLELSPGVRALFELTGPAGETARALYALRPSGTALLPVDSEIRSVTTSAQVLVTDAAAEESPTPEEFATIRPGPHPLIVRSERGTGSATYCAFALGGALWRLPHVDLLDLLRDLALPEGADEDVALRTDAPGCVTLTMARFAGGRLVHLVSSAGTVPLDGPVRLGPIELDLPGPVPASSTLLAPGKEAVALRARPAGGRFTLVVPGLARYALVALEDAPTRPAGRAGAAH